MNDFFFTDFLYGVNNMWQMKHSKCIIIWWHAPYVYILAYLL